MKIVVDTNVLISGIFFGGFPRKILSAIVGRKITACATAEIIDEYEEIVQEMIAKTCWCWKGMRISRL
jgi:putative PIN family toxin of toxin-antitoxin system